MKIRAALLAAGVIGGLVVPAMPAQATPPEHGTFSSTRTFVDRKVCAPEGFAVHVTQSEVASYRVFFNKDGSFKQAIVHLTYDATISANGHTIYETDRWQEFYYPDGYRYAGLTVHIKGPGGIVQLDAGEIVFNADGSVASIHGPHPQFEGQTFCYALVP